MWFCLNNAFLSVVAHRDLPDYLCVRARIAGDIERVFPGATVTETPKGDYRFRAVLPRAVVRDEIGRRITNIDYDNFKNSVAEQDRHDAYLDFWVVMVDLQRKRVIHGRKKAKTPA